MEIPFTSRRCAVEYPAMDATEPRDTQEPYWIAREGDLAVVGLTPAAQQAMGDVTYVELPRVGRTVRRLELVGIVESIKTASELTAPVAGRVAAVNDAVVTTPEIINRDPMGQGWLYKLDGVDAAEWSALRVTGA
jgi:glycine cleavage system H protein